MIPSTSTATGVVLVLSATLASAVFSIGSDDPFPSRDFCIDFAGDPNTLQMTRGVEFWGRLGMNDKLQAYIESDGKFNWAKTLMARDVFAATTFDNNCFDDFSGCDVFTTTQCLEFNHEHGAAITRALANLHRLLTAQIDAYDVAMTLWEENDAARAKALLSGNVSFGRRLGDFSFRSFFQGFLLGVQLAIPGISSPLASAIRQAIQKGLTTVIRNEVAPQFNLGDDPANDAGPFLDSLRGVYAQEKDAIRAVINSYFIEGNPDPSADASPQELVAFLQNGELLNGFSQTRDELVQEAAREVVKQTAAPIIASVWRNEGAEIEFVAQEFCPPDGLLRAVRVNGPFAFVDGPDDGLNFDPPRCIDLGGGFDAESRESRAQIGPFFMTAREVSLNAAKCKLEGFPPQQEGDEMVNGFPKCTFSLDN